MKRSGGGRNTSIPVKNGEGVDCIPDLGRVERIFTGKLDEGDTMSRRRAQGVSKAVLANVVHQKKRPPAYVGIDLARASIQVAVVNPRGKLVSNTKIKTARKDIADLFKKIPRGSWCVLESTSVWHGMYLFMTVELGLDIVVANPYQVRVIALSKKKTDENDAMMLARLLRSGDLPICYVPSEEAFRTRSLVRHRKSLVENRSFYKNKIHGVLHQDGISIKGYPFGQEYVAGLQRLGDYRINDYLDQVVAINRLIANADARIRKFAASDIYAQRLMTIPGVGVFTATVISAGVESIDRFPSGEALSSYIGVVPTVRDSGNVQHHGRITKMGDPLMRYVLVECITTHVRLDPDSYVTKAYMRIKKRKGHSRAAVAAALKMANLIYSLLRDNRNYVADYSPGPKRRSRGRRA